MTDPSPAELLREAREARASARLDAALEGAWRAFLLDRALPEAKSLLVAVFDQAPACARPEHAGVIRALLRDPGVDPRRVGAAGWVVTMLAIPQLGDGHPDDAAGRLEADDLALALLEETPVAWPEAERGLVRVRRRLLTHHVMASHPRLVEALKAQARLNGGAWDFDDEERALLETGEAGLLAEAYLPKRDDAADEAACEREAAVRRHYERWPYPRWRRLTAERPRQLPELIAELDPAAAVHLPAQAEILVAGCGTGSQAAAVAIRFPDARIVAIDVSAASLDYARRQCATLELTNLRFERLDLLCAAELGTRFHAIYCAGVLHHLPSPEAGWSALAATLAPGGVMSLALYSLIGRLGVSAARRRIADLAASPLDDDLIRKARRRLLEARDDATVGWITASKDFATLEGACDLLLHPHEDPFNVPRIGRAMAATGMRLLSFRLATPSAERVYDAAYPDDPRHRDLGHWAAFEKSHPLAFADMYRFWCCKPA